MVYMKKKLYYQYTKRHLSRFELQSIDRERWVKFEGTREMKTFDYQMNTFEPEVPSWLLEEEQNLRGAESSDGSYADYGQSTRGFTEFHRTATGVLAAGTAVDFEPRVRADSTIRQSVHPLSHPLLHPLLHRPQRFRHQRAQPRLCTASCKAAMFPSEHARMVLTLIDSV
jgi:hypothetical protein